MQVEEIKEQLRYNFEQSRLVHCLSPTSQTELWTSLTSDDCLDHLTVFNQNLFAQSSSSVKQEEESTDLQYNTMLIEQGSDDQQYNTVTIDDEQSKDQQDNEQQERNEQLINNSNGNDNRIYFKQRSVRRTIRTLLYIVSTDQAVELRFIRVFRDSNNLVPQVLLFAQDLIQCIPESNIQIDTCLRRLKTDQHTFRARLPDVNDSEVDTFLTVEGVQALLRCPYIVRHPSLLYFMQNQIIPSMYDWIDTTF